MRCLFVAAAFLAVLSGCKKAEKAAEAAKEVQQAPVKYVNDLQKDVRKAEAVKEKADANAQELERNLDAGEEQPK